MDNKKNIILEQLKRYKDFDDKIFQIMLTKEDLEIIIEALEKTCDKIYRSNKSNE